MGKAGLKNSFPRPGGGRIDPPGPAIHSLLRLFLETLGLNYGKKEEG